MTLRKKLLTPEYEASGSLSVALLTPCRILLSAPRRSPAVPNPDGKLALFTKSTYSFSTHSRANEVCLLDIAAGDVSTLSSDTSANEPKWLSDGTVVVWLKQTDNNNTSFIISDAASPGKTYSAGTVSGLVSNLKVYAVQAGEVAIAVSGQANPDGNLFNGKDQPKSHSSAKLYKSGFVRHWDRYLTAERNAIFTAVLKKSGSHVTGREGLYHLVGFKNALLGTGLECPIPPFGGTDHFDIGRKGLVFVAKDPDLNPATHTKCGCYYLPRQDPMDLKIPQPVKLETRGLEGAATSPTFSPDGNSIVVLQMKEDGYESDRNYVCFYHDLDRSQTSKADHVESSLFTHALGESWDRSPNSVQWAMDSRSVFMTAEDEGFNCIFELTLNQVRPKPRKLTSTGNIISFAPLSQVSPLLLVSSNSLISNSTYYILSPSDSTPCPKPISPWSTFSNPSPFSLSSSQVSSIHFPGSNKDTTIHAFLLKPSNFNPSHTYPLAYLIHGGPQGAWTDSWSTRWNPALFAEQGYIVVCPNPTGSTGYGQSFTDAIARDWGGAPYQDLVNGMDYLSTSPDHKYINMSRAVALGKPKAPPPRLRVPAIHFATTNPLSLHRRLLRRLHDKLPARPAAGPALRRARLPRRRLQPARIPVLHGRTLLPRARHGRRLLLPAARRARDLRRLRPRAPHAALGHAAADHPQQQGLPTLCQRGVGRV